MREFLEAVAQTLRNLGCGASAGDCHVRVNNMEFYADRHGNSFRFCGRSYRYGNVLNATLDLLRELPERERKRLAQLQQKANQLAAASLTRDLDDPCMHITYVYNQFVFTYKCDNLDMLRSMVTKITQEMQAAADAEWEKLLSTPVTSTVRFTAEGGFYEE